jgi:Protein tyrosine and serine/threonine kinase/Concanavalin A-like lectin/glucanases superfamily
MKWFLFILFLLLFYIDRVEPNIGWLQRRVGNVDNNMVERGFVTNAVRCVFNADTPKLSARSVDDALFQVERAQSSTVEAWIYLKSSVYRRNRTVLSLYPTSLAFGVNENSQVSIFDAVRNQWTAAPSSISEGKWVHVAYVLEPWQLSSSNHSVAELYRCTLYVDASRISVFNVSLVRSTKNSVTLLARQRSDECVQDNFVGFVSELRLWNVTRTAAHIGETMHTVLTGVEAHLTGYWRFNEPCDDTRAIDHSSYERPFKLVNASGIETLDRDVWSSDPLPPVCRGCPGRTSCSVGAQCQCVQPYSGNGCMVMTIPEGHSFVLLEDRVVVDSLTIDRNGSLSMLGSLIVQDSATVNGQLKLLADTAQSSLPPWLSAASNVTFAAQSLFLGTDGAHITASNIVHGKEHCSADFPCPRFGAHGGVGDDQAPLSVCGGGGETALRCSNRAYDDWTAPSRLGTPSSLPTGGAGGLVRIDVSGAIIVNDGFGSTAPLIDASGADGASGGAIRLSAQAISASRQSLMPRLVADGTSGGGGGRISVFLDGPLDVGDDLQALSAAAEAGDGFIGSSGTVFLQNGLRAYCDASGLTSCQTLLVRQHERSDTVTSIGFESGDDKRTTIYDIDYLIVDNAQVNFLAPFRIQQCVLLSGAKISGNVTCRARQASSPHKSSPALKSVWIIVTAVAATTLVLTLAVVAVLLVRRHRRRAQRALRSLDSMPLLSTSDFDGDASVHLPLGSAELDAVRQRIGDDALIDMAEVVLSSQPVAKGAFAAVYQGTYRGQAVAVKMMVADLDDVPIDVFYREVEALTSLQHANVVRFVGALIKPIGVVTEWAQRGSLTNAMATHRDHYERWPLKVSTMLDIARGMAFLHAQEPPLLHRDLKSPNVLVFDHFAAKLADFGLACSQALSMTMRMGTTRWTAPEVLRWLSLHRLS